MGVSARTLNAGRASIEFSLLKTKFEKQLGTIKGSLNKVAGGFAALGAAAGAAGGAITAAFAGTLSVFSDLGSAFADMSARTNVSVKILSELKFAAEQTGTSLEDVEKGLRQMQKKGMDPTKFFEVARSIQAIQNPAERARMAMKTWGKSGANLLPLIADLDSLRQKARDLGLVWSDEDAAKADRLGDAIDSVKSQFTALAAAIGGAVAPFASQLMEALTTVLAPTINFVKANGELVTVVGAVGVALLAIGAVLGTGAAAFAALAAAVGAASVAVGSLSVPVVAAGAVIAVLAVAIVEISAKFVDWKNVIDGVSGSLEKLFGHMQGMLQLKNTLGDVFNGVVPNTTKWNPKIQERLDAKAAAEKRAKDARTAADKSAYEGLRRAAVGMLPASLAAKLTGEKLPPGVESILTDLGRKLGEISNAGAAQDELLMSQAFDHLLGRDGFGPPAGSPVERAGRAAEPLPAMFDTRLANQMFGKGSDVEKQQLAIQKKIEANTRRGGGLAVI